MSQLMMKLASLHFYMFKRCILYAHLQCILNSYYFNSRDVQRNSASNEFSKEHAVKYAKYLCSTYIIYCPAKFYSHFFLSWSILKCVYCFKYLHLLIVINIQIVYEVLEFIVPLTISFAFLYVRSSNLDIVKKLMVVLLSN